MTVDDAISDLKSYVEKKLFILSNEAERVFREAESIGCKYNRDIYPYVFLLAIINTFADLRGLMLRKGCDPEEAKHICTLEALTREDDKYDDNLPPYSSSEGKRLGCREGFIDSAIATAIRHGRKEILKSDVIEGFLANHDQINPVLENLDWADSALHVAYNTLSHILGSYNKSLWITFDDIREELNLYRENEFRKNSVDSAPQRLKSALFDLFSDWPDYRKNCFLIMSFRETPFHREVHAALRKILSQHGFNLLRADDRAYSDDVLSNIETYIFGSKFAFSVHDRIENENHNANVSLEIGYLMGQGKHVCLLKEQSVNSLPSDLQGRLYVSFSMFNIESSLAIAVEGWLKSKRLIKSPEISAHA
ncbi:MAG TPA: TIR domain-containing protein [Pseudomonas sp.]|nr:TIR domain-containing protein [Pseudomonas sp.]